MKKTVPYITGDGVGVEITPAMQAIVNAAVKKAYGNEHEISPHPTPSHRRDGCRLYDDIVRRRSLLLRAVAGGSHHDDNDGGMFSRRNNHTSMADAVSLVAGRNDKLFLRSHDCI